MRQLMATILFTLSLSFGTAIMAQSSPGIAYQGLVLRSDSVVATSAVISLRLSLIQGTPDGNTVYVEFHQTTTNEQGFFNVEFGKGSRMGTTHLADIAWHEEPYFLKSEIDPDGEYDYRILSISELMSVPYALHAYSATQVAGTADSLQTAKIEQMFATIDARQHIDSLMARLRTTTIGCLPGVFSVAPQRAVQFSKGNLQYRASTATWRFAPHQYDIEASNNSRIASNNDGWIDLFGWGTSGWHGAARAYLPYAHSLNSADYADANLTDSLRRADWGINNIIDSSGNHRGLWRTLSASEMSYLLDQRQASTIGTTDDARYCYATVNNVRGLILFPDKYVHPTQILIPTAINQPTAPYTSNSYTAEQWDIMEQYGAVFLPAAGSRSGSNYASSSISRYWTSSFSETGKAFTLTLAEPSGMLAPCETHKGLAIRLVHE